MLWACHQDHSILDTDDILFKELQGGKRDIRQYLQAVIAEGKLPAIDPVRRVDFQEPNVGAGNDSGGDHQHGSMLHRDLVHEGASGDRLAADAREQLETGTDEEVSRFLTPGDLCILGASGFSDGQLAVYVRSVGAQQQFYTIRGNWRAAAPGEAELVAEQVVPPDALNDILPYFPVTAVTSGPLPQLANEGGVPRSVGAPLVQLLKSFDAAAIDHQRRLHEQLDSLHERLAHETDHRIVTVDDVLSQVLDQDPESATKELRFAVRKAIYRTPNLLVANRVGPFVESFTVQPRDRANATEQVVAWVREYQGYRKAVLQNMMARVPQSQPIAMFVEKAQRLAARSRQSRQPGPAASVSPSSANVSPGAGPEQMAIARSDAEDFSDADLQIISYLRSYALHPAQMTAGPLRATASYIIRCTDLYPDRALSAATCYLFLQEIGVFRPWENPHLLTDNLQLPGHGLAPAVDRLVRDTDSIAAAMQDASITDAMQGMRTDWKDLPVFCVDAVEAAEIDDGFSIEPADDSSHAFWVRVHVANPSAFLAPDSPLAQRAHHLKRSFYTPERVYSMLPGVLTAANFSLAPGRPTITFSAKLDKRGELLETDVRSGIVNNVVYFTPDKLRALLGVDRTDLPMMTVAVGEQFSKQSRQGVLNEVPSQHHSSLRQLCELMSARRNRRLEKGGLDTTNRYPATVKVYAGKRGIKPFSAQARRPSFYTGDPSIRSKAPLVDIFEKVDGVQDDLVSHVMLLAGEVAGQWCADRGIPAVYSATAYHPEFKRVTHSTLPDAVAHGLSTFGLPKGYTTSQPARHDFLGMEQYLKTTSPLRRFSDLLAHWQIEAALRHEDRHGRSVRPEEADSIMPFPHAAVEALITRGTWQNMAKDIAQRRSRLFWACQLMSRAFHYNEAALPKRWQCLIKSDTKPAADSDEHAQIGSLQPFDFACVVTRPRAMAPAQIGDLVEVELVDVNVYTLTIATRMVELIRRPPMGALAAMGFLL
ncbi:hypothetical protein KEM52_003359 [Ascosphaera acerosa]|nr:hypothetical protein KEM52_003359 [Ascosphaera acerosa]